MMAKLAMAWASGLRIISKGAKALCRSFGDCLVRRKFDARLFDVNSVDRHMNTFAEGKVG